MSVSGTRLHLMTARRALLATLVVAVSPYVGLKLLWLFGVAPGVRDPGLMSSTTYRVANAVTLLLDLVLVLVVVVLSGPRSAGRLGRLLAVPATIGLGLLLPVVLAAPTIAVAQVLAGSPAAGDDTGLAGWVYAVVYSGFGIQFGCLAVATAWHVAQRGLPAASTDRGSASRRALLAAAGFGLIQVVGLSAWVGGSDIGLLDVAPRTGRLLYAVLAVLVVAAAVLAARPTAPVRRLLALIATTAVWTWALFSLLTGAAAPDGAQLTWPGVAIWLCGAAAGLLGAAALIPRAWITGGPIVHPSLP